MAIHDALILGEALNLHEDLDTAFKVLGKAHLPMCQYVQDVSRAVSEAGTDEYDDNLGVRNAFLKDAAQTRVNQLYSKLSVLDELGAATLRGSPVSTT